MNINQYVTLLKSFRKTKTNRNCVGGSHRSATTYIVGDFS